MWKFWVNEFRTTPFTVVAKRVEESETRKSQRFLTGLYSVWTQAQLEVELLPDWEAFPHVQDFHTTLRRKFGYFRPEFKEAVKKYRAEKRSRKKHLRRDSKVQKLRSSLTPHWKTVETLFSTTQEVLRALRELREPPLEIPHYPLVFENEMVKIEPQEELSFSFNNEVEAFSERVPGLQ
jgi:hypothetical protein